MKVELLYFDGCPAYQTALEHLEEVIREEKPDARVEMIKIESDEQARRSRFPGSPTIRINGVDIEPEAGKTKDFSMRCRLYLEGDRISGWPSKRLIRRAVTETRKPDKDKK